MALLFLVEQPGSPCSAAPTTLPGPGSVDVGFLQDMRWHHDQAVRMSLFMMNKDTATQDPTVRSIAADILRTQQFEAGVMAGQLRTWGAAEANESGIGMAWMGMPVPIDRMQGMASADELERLKAATGEEADLLFLQLMRVHHEGGLHMALDAMAARRDRRGPDPGRVDREEPGVRARRAPPPRSPAHRRLTPPDPRAPARSTVSGKKLPVPRGLPLPEVPAGGTPHDRSSART